MFTKASGREYACLFCLTGRENRVIHQLRQRECVLGATTVRMMKRKTDNGETTLQERIVLPGYVFVEVRKDLEDVPLLLRTDDVISVLSTREGEWRLSGQDRRFAEWIFSQNGLVEFSKAYQEGGRIRMISGPLKDLERSIARVDRRNHNGQVCLTIGGRKIMVWLGFELVDGPGA